MAPNSSLRRGSDASASHASALAAIHRRGSSQSSTFGGSGSREGSTSRWATTIRNQLHRIERDGLRRTFWNRGRQLGSGNTASSSSLPITSAIGKAWDRIRRIPDLLFVESEDPVDGVGSLWTNAGAAAATEGESSYTSDLFDEKDDRSGLATAESRKLHTRRRSSGLPATRLQKAGKVLDRVRRTLGMSRPSFLLLLILLILGLYETLLSSGQTSRGASRKDGRLRIYPGSPYKTLAQAGIRLPASSSANLDAKASHAIPSIGVNPATLEAALAPMRQSAKTTAILLNWKRLENLSVIVAHLCAHSGSIFDSVHIWNNNPEVPLTHNVRPEYLAALRRKLIKPMQTFTAARCPKTRLRIYNSPGNLLFMGRYMACAQADTPYVCQDDAVSNMS